ncbi:hypothetical protein [Selenomonas ruminantium]|uniref:Uncharacterized protein n=1 Tax=Selenomonas ruminantium TaxID=971 RepID=A0A1I0YB99_SELRU|nr:hypothetical protein [Selenomonas ruminantium]SFB10619.1 hypothetical protein SAMN05216587_11183 [Selenomonas ruminantium]
MDDNNHALLDELYEVEDLLRSFCKDEDLMAVHPGIRVIANKVSACVCMITEHKDV